MDIFISWHGKRSHAVAVALRDWLPQIVNAFKPWLSSADINKGANWRIELATKLRSVSAGIFCLTPSALNAPWLIFEAGAISKAPEQTYVCTLLVGLQSSDVKDPLGLFQATKTTKEDINQLVRNLNNALGEQSMEDAFVDRAFEKWWPDLEKTLNNLPPEETAPPPKRSELDLLEELLERVKDLSQSLKPPATDLAQLRSLREIVNTPEERGAWYRMRNVLAHQQLDPDALRRAVDVAYKSSGFENAAEFNRALQLVADVAIGQAARAKKDETQDGRKAKEEAKPADPAKPAIPGHPQKTQGGGPRPEPDSK